MGRLRHGEHGRPERPRATPVPTKASRVRFTFTRAPAGFRVVRAAYIPTTGTTTRRVARSGSSRSTGPSRRCVTDRERLLEARRMTRLAVDGLNARAAARLPDYASAEGVFRV